MADYSSALDFLRQNATADDNGNFRITQKNWAKYMSDCGLTSDIIKAYHNAEKDLLNAMYVYNAEEVLKRCEEAKKKGESPEEIGKIQVTTAVNIPDGNIKMTTSAVKKYRVPNQEDKEATKTMVAKLTFAQARKLDGETLKTYEDKLAESLGF